MAIAVPDVRERVTGRAQPARFFGSEFAVGLAMRDEALKKWNSVENRYVAAPDPGHDQEFPSLSCILCRHHHVVGIWCQEEDEELLLDGVHRNAAVAYRPFDEGADFILGVVEQELVARSHR